MTLCGKAVGDSQLHAVTALLNFVCACMRVCVCVHACVCVCMRMFYQHISVIVSEFGVSSDVMSCVDLLGRDWQRFAKGMPPTTAGGSLNCLANDAWVLTDAISL